MRKKRAAELEARFKAVPVSSDEEMDLPSPQTLNGLFEVNVPPKKLFIENSTAESEFCVSEAEIADDLMREHLEYGHNAEIKINLLNELRQCALQNKISLTALTQILKLLNKVGIENLPLDARTILKTPRTTEVIGMRSGEFWYDGIARNLVHSLSSLKVIPNNIELIVNVDGIPPFISTGKDFWPISIRLFRMKSIKPMFVAIYYGHGKPPLGEFLYQFIEEFNNILANGLNINGKQISVGLKCFSCDTPARFYLKCIFFSMHVLYSLLISSFAATVYFNSKEGSCIKCTVSGIHDKKFKHTSFAKFDFHDARIMNSEQ